MDFVSILIPVYNSGQYIEECIESALSQKYDRMEVVISDNNSTDNSWDIIKRYEKRENVIINRNVSNIGPISNWKKCFQLSRGKWIKFLFSDDVIANCHLKNLMELVRKYEIKGKNVTGVFSPVYIFRDKGEKTLYYDNNKQVMSIEDLFLGYLFGVYSIPVSPCAGIFRRDIVDNALRWNPEYSKARESYEAGYGVDMMIYLMSALNGYLLFSSEPSVYFRYHKSSISVATGHKYSNWGYKAPIIDIVKNYKNDKIISIVLMFVLYNLVRNNQDRLSISNAFISNLRFMDINYFKLFFHSFYYSRVILKSKIRRLLI